MSKTEKKQEVLKEITLVNCTEKLGYYFYKPETKSKTEVFVFLVEGLNELTKWKEQGIISEPERLDLATILFEKNNILDISKIKTRKDRISAVQNALHSFYEIFLNDNNIVKKLNQKKDEVKQPSNTTRHSRGIL
jgi:hypothetical protein